MTSSGRVEEHKQLCSTRQTEILVLSVWSTSDVAVATDCVRGFFDNSDKLEVLISSYIRKWLGVPCCLSKVKDYCQ